VPTLAETADSLEAAARRLYDEGQKESAAELFKAAADVRKAMKAATALDTLTGGKYSPTIRRVMDADHREAISKGRAGRNPLLRKAREAGIPTLGALAKALTDGGYPVKPSFLSQVAHGDKKLPPDLGRRIRELTGWEP
jgi:hypothetical protein